MPEGEDNEQTLDEMTETDEKNNQDQSSSETQTLEPPVDTNPEDYKNPSQEVRRQIGTAENANPLSDSEAAKEVTGMPTELSSMLDVQEERIGEFERIKAMFESQATEEEKDNIGEKARRLAKVRKTGRQEIETWDTELNTTEYTEDTEFFEEAPGLIEYVRAQENEISNLDSRISRKLDLIEDKVGERTELEEERKETKTEYDQEIEQTQSEYESEIEETEAEYEQEVSELEQELEQELDTLENEREGRIDDLENQIDEMDEEELEDRNFESFADLFNAGKQSVEEDIEEQESQTQSEYESEIEETEAEYEQEVSELEQELEQEVTDLEQEKQEELEEIDDELEGVREDINRFEESKQAYVSERAERTEEMQQVHSQYFEDVSQYVSNQLDSLVNNLETLRNLQMNEEEFEEGLYQETELDQGQDVLRALNSQAGAAVAAKAIQRIEEVESAVEQYKKVASETTDRVETEVGSLEQEYANLLPDSYEDSELYQIFEENELTGLSDIRGRVENMTEDILGTDSYDSVNELLRYAEGRARSE